MLHSPLLIQLSTAFWPQVARALLDPARLELLGVGNPRDLASIRVVVPTFAHVQLLKAALAQQIRGAFIPPRICTMSAWIALQPPQTSNPAPMAHSERLMALYAQLRQHAWLKKLFAARRNTDLLPLAQMLLTLSDELTQSLLPDIQAGAETVAQRWQEALAQFSPSARQLLSDETQLVWSIWKSQLDTNDPCAALFAQMMRLADDPQEPLIWVSPTEPDAFDSAFLKACGERQTVLPVMLDWRTEAVSAAYATAWRELVEEEAVEDQGSGAVATPANIAFHQASSLESLALGGAQTVIDWLAAGKSSIAIIAQDRVAARRIRALLERAQVLVSDETGWKLSTTRAAAALAAWFDVIATRADTVVLLDFLKSPFLSAELADQVMPIEIALRRANVQGGWEAVSKALASMPAERALLSRVAAQAGLFVNRRTLREWMAQTHATLLVLKMQATLESDAAGKQVIDLLESLKTDCAGVEQAFSFAEWRAFISLQLEATAFVPVQADKRVAMLPLNGARLRCFDAVLVVGADADHLPSRPEETLFFANAVRHELGLATRESRQRQQLRDFTELLESNPEVVLSWQSHKDGEPNAVSPWIARLQLALAVRGLPAPKWHQVDLGTERLVPIAPAMPAPAAPQLMPGKLSASGYNILVACPYQFFATRMLRLSGLDELSDLPEKRDYGDWLHRILKQYHDAVRDRQSAPPQRAQLLADISEKFFADVLDTSPAALGYYTRWQKAMPAYLAWAEQHEAKGWRFEVGEREFSTPLQTDAGEITLHGRIDRIDRNDADEFAVLDYKTRDLAALKKKLREGEDHQLAFYGLLANVPVASAHLVALEARDGKAGDAPADNYGAWQQALEAQIKASVVAISRGAGLPAHGVESVCRYCDVRGLCRKGNW
jgi:ATP-dependent helicase/nuclease subunit B